MAQNNNESRVRGSRPSKRSTIAIISGQLIQYVRKNEWKVRDEKTGEWVETPTLGRLAERLAELGAKGLQSSTLSRLERGEMQLDLPTIMAFEEAFGWETGEFNRRVQRAYERAEQRTREKMAQDDQPTPTPWWQVAAAFAGVAAIAALTMYVIEEGDDRS